MCRIIRRPDLEGKFTKFFEHDNVLYTRVQTIEPVDYKGVVYDLQMPKHHRYVTVEGGMVHNGGGKRKGSIAVYLEPWHADIEEFLELRLVTGKEEARARDLFYALWISDLLHGPGAEQREMVAVLPRQGPRPKRGLW